MLNEKDKLTLTDLNELDRILKNLISKRDYITEKALKNKIVLRDKNYIEKTNQLLNINKKICAYILEQSKTYNDLKEMDKRHKLKIKEHLIKIRAKENENKSN